MKLKKIASLMLAGVMAVSMLAGCSGKSNGGDNDNGGNTVVEPSTSSIVTAFNNGQDEDNKVKVTFSSNASLDAALKKAVENSGDYTQGVTETIEDLLGEDWGSLFTYSGNNLLGPDDFFDEGDSASTGLKDKKAVTAFGVRIGYSNIFWSEENFVDSAVRELNEYINEFLDATTKNDGLAQGEKYYDFSYTGNVSMVSSQQEGGNTVYYIAYTITQTAAEQTVKAE